jgi:hypothetical protein
MLAGEAAEAKVNIGAAADEQVKTNTLARNIQPVGPFRGSKVGIKQDEKAAERKLIEARKKINKTAFNI